MPVFVITANNQIDSPLQLRAFKGEVVPVSFDFKPWADDNTDLTSASWEVERGNAAVSDQSFSGNVAAANLTLNDNGRSLIKITATNGTLTKAAYLSVFADDPTGEPLDYRT